MCLSLVRLCLKTNALRGTFALLAVLGSLDTHTSALGSRGGSASAPLSSLSQVRKLTRAEANRAIPIHLRAVVTYFDPISFDFFISDKTDGSWVEWTPDLPRPSVGDLIDLEAQTRYLDFSPELALPHWRVLGKTPLPAPERVTYDQMANTSQDSRWVEVSGLIRQVEYLHSRSSEKILWLDLAMAGGHADVQIPWDGRPIPSGLVDSRVSIRGVCGAAFNSKNQMVGVILYVAGLQWISTLQTADPQTIEGFPTPINTLQRYGYNTPIGHRIKIAGVVTAVLPQSGFYLRDESGSVNVETRQSLSLQVGDRVEALGFRRLRGAPCSSGRRHHEARGKSQAGSPRCADCRAGDDWPV